MPTYAYRCDHCGDTLETFMTIGQYMRNPPTFIHCGDRMERFFTVRPGSALENALASERHYEGMRATDGADISTRAKHRAYMKEKGVTTADDFKDTWKKAREDRAARAAGVDPSRRADVAHAFEKHRG